jgi:hypothetical protein
MRINNNKPNVILVINFIQFPVLHIVIKYTSYKYENFDEVFLLQNFN